MLHFFFCSLLRLEAREISASFLPIKQHRPRRHTDYRAPGERERRRAEGRTDGQPPEEPSRRRSRSRCLECFRCQISSGCRRFVVTVLTAAFGPKHGHEHRVSTHRRRPAFYRGSLLLFSSVFAAPSPPPVCRSEAEDFRGPGASLPRTCSPPSRSASPPTGRCT